MKNLLIVAFFTFSYTTSFCQNNYGKAWNALNHNNRTDAEKFLNLAMNESESAQDAYITNIYLQSYNGKESGITDFSKNFYSKYQNPYPYIYALWFNNALLGDYGKKTDDQLQLIDQIIEDTKAPGTLVAAANYQKGSHYLFSADFDKAREYYKEVGNIKNWQFTGPFENLSESGFYKDYGPLEHPGPNAVFKSLTNADVKWFTPPSEIKDGWTPVAFQFNKNAAIVYAQNFVTSHVDQTVYCNLGFSGTVKMWINDELVISESKQRMTEMDCYTIKYDLKKGVNRILIQLGYTNISYPNFTVRFTDENNKAISNITGSSTYASYPKYTGPKRTHELIPNIAEKYFKEKIQKQPKNLVNYLLLADVYLRNEKLLEARDLMNVAITKEPGNSLLRIKLIQILNKQNNTTLFQEELEKVKQADPESFLVLELRIKELYNNEKYNDCANELDKMLKLHGEDQFTDGYRILLLLHDKKYDDLVKASELMYAKYPDNKNILSMMYNIKKEIYKDNKGALKVYENYIKHNFDYDTYVQYADILIDQGNTKKGIDFKEKLAGNFSYSPQGFYNLSKYYYTAKQYDKAEDFINKALSLAPYTQTYWEQLGDIKNEKKDVSGALKSFNQSLKFDPNQYDIISKIRKLNNKPDIYKLFPEVDVDQVIKEDKPAEAKNTDYGFYYILDQKDVVIYSDGASEQYVSLVIKITNDKGVDQFKESTIGYNNSQTLLIEKAEIIKENQSKIEGERNENQIVFTNLQPGDIVVFRYRLQNYTYGRFAKDFWDSYVFGGKVYSAKTKYNLLIPKDQKINFNFLNSNIKPVISSVEDFNVYSWQMTNPEPLKDEPLMPLSTDIGTVLHLSTIASWKEIANWYSDVCNNKSEMDFEIKELYKKLFPDEKKVMTQFEKAKIIYDYIESNIRYSSVSFRQSAYVPQKASATLNTRLGDCKDLSNLFVMLARMAGIKAQMVLVDTRDNGQKDMMLPSVEFNHCIAKAELDHKNYYIELTDSYLPFTSLPNNLNGALALEIPVKSTDDNADLIHLKSETRVKDVIKRVMDIKPVDDDISVDVRTVKYGAFTSSLRETYKNLDYDKQEKEMEKSVAGSYKNTVTLDKLSFNGLDNLCDSVQYNYHYKVQNEVAEIGSLNTFKISYPDIVATLDNFSSDKRIYPIEYWSYENADAYETIVNITAPDGKKFVELPKNEILSFKDLKYSIEYTLKAPGKLVITRKFSCGREQEILPENYPAFKSFFEKIIKAEQKFIAYK